MRDVSEERGALFIGHIDDVVQMALGRDDDAAGMALFLKKIEDTCFQFADLDAKLSEQLAFHTISTIRIFHIQHVLSPLRG